MMLCSVFEKTELSSFLEPEVFTSKMLLSILESPDHLWNSLRAVAISFTSLSGKFFQDKSFPLLDLKERLFHKSPSINTLNWAEEEKILIPRTRGKLLKVKSQPHTS